MTTGKEYRGLVFNKSTGEFEQVCGSTGTELLARNRTKEAAVGRNEYARQYDNPGWDYDPDCIRIEVRDVTVISTAWQPAPAQLCEGAPA